MKRNNLPRVKLHHQAGAKSSKNGQKKTPVPGTNMDTLRHVHELQAPQIEPETHNEESQARAEIEAALRQYTNLYDFAPVGYFILRRDGTICQANLSGGQLLGIKREELIEQCFRQFVSTEFYSVLASFLETVFCGHRKEACEIKLLKNKREPIWVRIDATCSDTSFQQGTCHLVVHDITEQKRAENILQVRFRITEFAAEHSLNELLQNALDELCALTDSPIGFFHFVESDQRTLSLQAWSTYTLKEMCTAEGRELHYDIDQAGVWADCVRQGRPIIHNDYASLPHRKGLPKGHATVDREMVFPIIRNQKIVAIIGIGNKSVDYTDSDLAYASRLADVVWDITEHKRAEEALRKSEERYKRMFEDSPISLWEEDFSQVKAYFDNLRLQASPTSAPISKIIPMQSPTVPGWSRCWMSTRQP
jgi:PAS domain S-box-containing protein